MKKLLSLIGLAFGLASFTSQAQLAPNDKIDGISVDRLEALFDQNPAQPIYVSNFAETDCGNDVLLLTFDVQGIGWWACWEVTTASSVTPVNLCGWTRSTGQTTHVALFVQGSTFVSIFVNQENAHGMAFILLPPLEHGSH